MTLTTVEMPPEHLPAWRRNTPSTRDTLPTSIYPNSRATSGNKCSRGGRRGGLTKMTCSVICLGRGRPRVVRTEIREVIDDLVEYGDAPEFGVHVLIETGTAHGDW